MGRIRNTFTLARTSWHVLQKDRELLALPVLSFLGALAALPQEALRALFGLETTTTATGVGYAMTRLSSMLW
ncbi:MAG: hypothetical protein GWP48_15780, partial [Actinobacteria bacterium]|nr:hypothetical protein [Actinomycetota bacterium]